MVGLRKARHDYLAFPFMLGLVIMFLIWIKDTFPGNRPAMAQAGRRILFEASIRGQTLQRRPEGHFLDRDHRRALMSVSGWFLLFPLPSGQCDGAASSGRDPCRDRDAVHCGHDGSHLLIGSSGWKARSMRWELGEVDLNWAREHHSLWVEEEQAKGHAPVGRHTASHAGRIIRPDKVSLGVAP